MGTWATLLLSVALLTMEPQLPPHCGSYEHTKKGRSELMVISLHKRLISMFPIEMTFKNAQLPGYPGTVPPGDQNGTPTADRRCPAS